MYQCKLCMYMFKESEMQRISLSMFGSPYNICYGCCQEYKNKGMWDDRENDIDWNKVPCIDESYK